MVVNFIGTSGDLLRARRRMVFASAFGSPEVRATILKVAPLNACCLYVM
jgi:hypothetical protein